MYALKTIVGYEVKILKQNVTFLGESIFSCKCSQAAEGSKGVVVCWCEKNQKQYGLLVCSWWCGPVHQSSLVIQVPTFNSV